MRLETEIEYYNSLHDLGYWFPVLGALASLITGALLGLPFFANGYGDITQIGIIFTLCFFITGECFLFVGLRFWSKRLDRLGVQKEDIQDLCPAGVWYDTV